MEERFEIYYWTPAEIHFKLCMEERFEIYYWTPAEIQEYENEYGSGLFTFAVNSCDFDVTTYGEYIGGCEDESDIQTTIYNYFGNTSHPGYVGVWDNDEEEWY